MFLHPVIQSRVRQLLGLEGGPSIEAIEAVQPVALVAGFPADRQPQLESGDMLIRKFTAGVSVAAGGAGTYATAAIRVSTSTAVLWVQRITIHHGGGSTRVFQIGRGANQTAGTWGNGTYNDFRLPGNDLGATFFEVFGCTPVGLPTQLGRHQVVLIQDTHLTFPCDYVLGYGLGNLLVVNQSANVAITYVTFEGIAFEAGR